MEKLIAFNLDETGIKEIYKICSQMKIAVICVPYAKTENTLKQMTEMAVYKGGIIADDYKVNEREESMVVMCDFTEKHMNRLLSFLRMGSVNVNYKAVLTAVNGQWSGKRMLVQMEAEKRAYEKTIK